MSAPETRRAVLSVGANLGDAEATLRDLLAAFRADLDVVAVSPLYATPPWGVTDQPEFRNGVVVADTTLTPPELLRYCQARERDAGRERTRRWGPRTLDVDIVTVRVDGEDVTWDDAALTLPHPWALDRAFVVVPWLDVEPDARLGGTRVADVDVDATGLRWIDGGW